MHQKCSENSHNISQFDEPMQKVWDYALYLLLSHCCESSTCITPKWEAYLSNLYHQLSEKQQYQLVNNCMKLAEKHLFKKVPSEFWADSITIKLIHKKDIFQYDVDNTAIYDITHIILENKDYELSVYVRLFSKIMWDSEPAINFYLRPKHSPQKCKVFYEYWQMACCGRRFDVGDKVHWLVRACMYDNDKIPDSFECSYSYEAHESSFENLEILDGTVVKIYA